MDNLSTKNIKQFHFRVLFQCVFIFTHEERRTNDLRPFFGLHKSGLAALRMEPDILGGGEGGGSFIIGKVCFH
jgi:hypothetical protein